MRHEKYDEIAQWLLKSWRDLEAAKLLFNSEKSLLDLSVYHCQQSAEKALKAYLTYKDFVFGKTHNLVLLIELCSTHDSDFENLRDCGDVLTPYGTEFRYPGDLIEPERRDTQEAIDMAITVFSFVVQKLPDVHLSLT
ncbi:HEPN domain-containing protein [Cylindrospermopsis raciborskii]|uniref:HEPN domain-containing protein n=1 Tax=Cylindrospermopsis raciborskii CENA302 TaxID=1170768 RepID=A0A9Q5QWQ8_9CYAN|nr:HEPN domain-containing protein [Cylindrospermopsis raciborskii]NLQ04453.1 HEPN domain-containing protein [Cylindrospermopsis raciborskii MVCC19]OHY35759.1 hypothetical protein BCV64_03000 [Cylindrospermopsis raciborskii MVCC14]OHY35792.1 hypothetical protein BCV64_02915 [Cylindrospermopsis raciborskii MVCC14]OPH09555.1 hypothetical protein CENA302_10065 [Cylindrospermopsis raciborskii CENA302]